MEKIPARPKFEEGENWEAPLKDIVPDSGLFETYPQLKNIIVGYKYLGVVPNEGRRIRGGYFYNSNRILIETQNNRDFQETLKHEVDHAIKRITGGPEGGAIESNAMEGSPNWKRARKKYRNISGEKLAREAERIPRSRHEHFPGHPLSNIRRTFTLA